MAISGHLRNGNAAIHLLDRVGKDDRRGKSSHHIIPDAVILDIRRKHEVERKTHLQIHEEYPQYSVQYIRQVLGYIIRANVRAK